MMLVNIIIVRLITDRVTPVKCETQDFTRSLWGIYNEGYRSTKVPNNCCSSLFSLSIVVRLSSFRTLKPVTFVA